MKTKVVLALIDSFWDQRVRAKWTRMATGNRVMRGKGIFPSGLAFPPSLVARPHHQDEGRWAEGSWPSSAHLQLGVSAAQVFQLYSTRKQLAPPPPAFVREGVLGRWEHPRLFLKIRRRQGLGEGAQPTHRCDTLRVSLPLQGVNQRADP